MLQNLFEIPARLGGVPMFGFGLLLAVWLIFSAALLAWLVHRQGFNADTRGYLPILGIVALIIAFVLPATLGPDGGLPIRGYGSMLVVAVVAASALALVRARRLGFDSELLLSMAFRMFVAGIIGARLFYVVEYWQQMQGRTPLATLLNLVNVAQGGLVVYGAIFGGAVAMILFLRAHGLPALAVCDLVAPSVALGMGLGRVGCFLNGCCFGGPSDLPWAVCFPPGSPPFERQMERGEINLHGLLLERDFAGPPIVARVAEDSPAQRAGVTAGERILAVNGVRVDTVSAAWGQLLTRGPGQELELTLSQHPRPVKWTLPDTLERSLPVEPTQIYSAIDGVLLCLLLLALDPYRRRDGELLAWVLTLHPVSRFLLEMIRVDEGGVLGTSLSIAQVISLGLLAAAAVTWLYLRGRPPGVRIPIAPFPQSARA